MKKKIITAVAVLLLSLVFCIQSFAEFGEYAGDSDYGDSGGSYGDNDYDYDDDDYDDDKDKDKDKKNYYYSYTDYPNGGGPIGGGTVYDFLGNAIGVGTLNSLTDSEEADEATDGVLGAFIVGIGAIIAIVIVRKKRGNPYSKSSRVKSNKNLSKPEGAKRTDQTLLTDIKYFVKSDPNFSEHDFCEKISNMYVQFQNAWTKKNMEELRPYLTDALFNQFNNQLETYRRDKTTNYVERIAVLGVHIKGFMKQGENYAVVTELRTRIVDYVTDDNTGEVIRGSKTAEKFMTYEWTLSRKIGIQTGVSDGLKSRNCPHCGAPLDINKSAKCEYCGSIIKDDAFDWVVSSIKGIAQQTGR